MTALSLGKVNPPKSLCGLKPLVADLRCFVLLIFLAPFFFAGCAVQQLALETDKDAYRILPAKYQKKALDYERRGMYREAMQSWWIVRSFYPDDAKIKKRIKTLRQKSKAKAADHFKKGESFYRDGLVADARREFLLTLTYDQGHGLALDFLKEKLPRPIFKTYAVRYHDTVREVAGKELHDPDKDFLITAFNDIDSYGELMPGTTLQIPLLGEDFPGKEKFAQARPQNGAMLLEPRRQKRKVVAAVEAYSPEKIIRKMTQPADGKKSEGKRDIETYRKAKEFLDQEEYGKALQVLRSVDINFRDVRQLIASTEVFLQQEADAHYRKGISYFLSEDLDKAIREWEEVLRLSPNHLKAQKDLQNARRLQQKVKKY